MSLFLYNFVVSEFSRIFVKINVQLKNIKIMNLELLGVQEMGQPELINIDGGYEWYEYAAALACESIRLMGVFSDGFNAGANAAAGAYNH